MMSKRKNTRINTLFSELAFNWLLAEATEQNKSLAQVVVLVQRELDKRLFVISYKVSPSGSFCG
jgi:hypothetical protein